MKIVVAGAGAGKTTSMAQIVLERLKEVTDQKIIYVVTYTNAARDRVREKIVELNGTIPKQLFIETLHAFLLREFIFPFHHLIFEQQYTKVAHIQLSDNAGFKASKIKELATNKFIHVEKVTETAKWIICKKSGDRKINKEKREKVLSIVTRYLDSVFIDEAQDMDKHLVGIMGVLNERGIKIQLVGDPKQDLRGRNAFKELITCNKEHVTYIPDNHRCPISHVILANHFVTSEEKQTPQSDIFGKLNYAFESSVEVSRFITSSDWDYVFIYNKNEKFMTHTNDTNLAEQSLTYELSSLVKRSNVKESERDKFVYIIKKAIMKDLDRIGNFAIFNSLERYLSVSLTRQDKGKLGAALDLNREVPKEEGLLVNSIDSVKGLEGNKCLFLLTTELAPYFFGENKEQNKMLNYLYVALTRSKEELMIMVTKEVEEKYGRDFINNQLGLLGFKGNVNSLYGSEKFVEI
ncbi:UvrD-helicase domain-containing protein [Niallia sp. FSL R7-0648]|uniref:UvrD-helicase domain-containing protein n=1 Tax=Niallia sp. FSL R7-0648 TaxID=2954521 RepID=UPI0030FAD1FB